MMLGFLGKRSVLNVGLSTDHTGREFRVVEGEAIDCTFETFNAYMSHEAM